MHGEISDNLPMIVDCLLFVVREEPILQKPLCDLLDFLFVKQESLFQKSLSILDPLPKLPCLEMLRRHHKKIRGNPGSLDEVFEKFWQSYKSRKGRMSVEGLQELLFHIRSKKKQLKIWVVHFQNHPVFLEHMTESPFHLVMSCLVRICITGTPEVQQTAAKCLGEIGPVDLGGSVLYPIDRFMENEIMSQKVENLFIFSSLLEYLTDERIDVVQASYSVLMDVFRTQYGKHFLASCKHTKFMKYLQPFFTNVKEDKTAKTKAIVGDCSALDDFDLWVPSGASHERWVKNLVCTLIKIGTPGHDIFHLLKPLCEAEVSFCEKLLPFVVHNILLENHDKLYQQILSKQVTSFFSKHCQMVDSQGNLASRTNSSMPGICHNSVVLCRASVQTMLNVIDYLRKQPKPSFTAPARDNNNWLNVDYLDIAMAAQFCGQHFTVLFYTELWCDATNQVMSSSQSSDSNNSDRMISSHLPFLSSVSPYKAGVIQQLLLKAYKQVGDQDGIYGCTMLFEDSRLLQKSHFKLDNRWDRILQTQDAEAISNSSSSELTLEGTYGILKALQKCGLSHTLQGYVSGMLFTSSELQQPSSKLLEFQCECAWRLGRWDVILPETSLQFGIQQPLYKSLLYLPLKEFSSVEEEVWAGREKVLFDMKNICINQQAAHNLYPFLADLRLFSLVHSSLNILQNSTFETRTSLSNLLDQWSAINEIPFHDFVYVEPSLCLQVVLLKLLTNEFPSAISALKRSLEYLLTLARQQGHLQVADQTLQRLMIVQSEGGEQDLRWRLEEARNRWCRGETASARQILKTLLKPLQLQQEESPEKALVYAETLMQLGNWQAEACFENPTTILADFLEKAVSILTPLQNKSEDTLWEGHLSVARYADLRFQQIRKHRQSQAFTLKIKLKDEAVEKALKIRRKGYLTEDDQRAIITLEKHSEIDKKEIQDLQSEYEDMLNKAIHNYLCCLKGTDLHDLIAFRVVTLWFENSKDLRIIKLLDKELPNLQTYKFLPLIYQLAARMDGSDSNNSQSVLLQLIYRLCKEHPYHSIPVMLALCNADKDTNPSTQSSSGMSGMPDGGSSEKHQKEANSIVAKLKASGVSVEYVLQLESLSLSYIELAYYDHEPKSIPENSILLKPNLFSKVPIITEELNIQRSLEYKDLVHVSSFETSFELCGGINKPKVVTCIGSDGKKRKQLVKGYDDLRQDAVMQQVFGLVNRLLKKDPETMKRKLIIRTYKVVPLSSRSGVIQWCEGTLPIGAYLTGDDYESGAHRKYHPGQISAGDCRSNLKTSKNKLATYMNICKQFSPVFRYFFLENFPEPSVWYERRLAYTRSVATGSIVGYILGLGDRHLQNILVDKFTAEIIHIDLGVAFEQGRTLAPPETVPFRLTRDIIDGMGLAGVEGVFRRCCEKSMEVMRASSESLLTILEVLLYDPLYVWSISSQEAAIHQQRHDWFDDSVNSSFQAQTVPSRHIPENPIGGQKVNKLAERVLLRLREKLQGVEDSVALSVPGQVSLLIQQAIDPNNLCRLYYGWQPYL